MPEALTDARWFVLAGVVFVAIAIGGTVLRRLPVTGAILYLALGVAAGPIGLGLIRVDIVDDAGILELLSELAVIVSLFTAGLKLRDPIRHVRWRRPIRLASVSMTVTVALVALVGTTLLGLPLGAAVLLGAVLAPTDPVLASDVQVAHPADRDELRFSLTGEAGFNDGSAFPFVMLGLGLLGVHELGPGGARWLVVDVVWAVGGGLVIGAVLGTLVARMVLYLRQTHREAIGLDEFLCLGLIGLSYGVALLLGTYAFLAVFAAGLAVRRIERNVTEEAGADALRAAEASPGVDAHPPVPILADEARLPVDAQRPLVDEGTAHASAAADLVETAAHAVEGPAYMARELLGFNERLERIGEVAVVVVIGALLSTTRFPVELLWFAPVLFLLIRPVAVIVGLAGSGTPRPMLALVGWFGIRGIGSLYYLTFAIVHGAGDPSRTLAELTLWIVAISIVAHGVSVTPLMARYEAWSRGRSIRRRAARAD